MGDLSYQHSEISHELKQSLKHIFKEGSYVGGNLVARFETRFSSYVGASHCVGVGNGTDALEIILLGLGLQPGSRVIVPANSFVASAEAVVNVGLIPVLVDVDETYSLDRDAFERAIDSSVSAVIVVHLYGYPQDIGWIKTALAGRDIRVVEDCAQAHGARRDGSHVGTFGDAGAFSFYPGKNLGALGDAGAIVTSDEGLADRCRRIANHGRLGKFDHDLIGRNSRLDAIQAAALTIKLGHLDSWNARRRANANSYREGLSGLAGLQLPPESLGFEVYHQFVVRTDQRDELRAHLGERGIQSGIHYPQSIDEMEPFSEFASSPATLSRLLSSQMVSLPVAEHLGEREVRHVAKAVREFLLGPSSS
jgi:dTDP-4-amino-4,6-dideoxygalactose transaminase